MNFSEIKDYIREHFGRVGIPTSFLTLALELGRKEIENHSNFWWMEDSVDFNLTAADNSYPLTSGTINESNFKDLRALYWRISTDNFWTPIPVVPMAKEDLDLEYDTDEDGEPEQAVIFNDTLYIYPIPDSAATYSLRMYFYQYTSYPAQTSSDDLIKGFPMAVIYSALAQGYETELKDLQSAAYWRKLLKDTIPMIKKEHLKRSWMDKIILEPRTGPFRPGSRMRLDNVQIYKR
jgi:hypothetical protein